MKTNEMDKNTTEGKLFHLEQDIRDLAEAIEKSIPDVMNKPILAVLTHISDELSALQDEVAPPEHVLPVKTSKEIAFLRVEGKCSDRCSIDFIGKDGSIVHQHNGEVPSFMPGQHWGDSLIFSINVASGMITNWGESERYGLRGFMQSLLQHDVDDH